VYIQLSYAAMLFQTHANVALILHNVVTYCQASQRTHLITCTALKHAQFTKYLLCKP